MSNKPKGKDNLAKLAKVELNLEQKEYLSRIGLSKEAIQLYELLLQKGKLSAQGAATYTGDFPSAEYRLFYLLEEHRLVRRLSGRPRRFVALPLATGLASSLQNNEQSLKQLLGKMLNGGPEQTTAGIVLGRQAVYDAYIRHASAARHEIRLYSIGIAFSDKLEAAQRSAIKRGVSIKHVIQQKTLTNQYVIAKWLRAGVRLRHFKQARGFHFFIIDQSIVCITFSDPEDTDNRISLISDNPAVVNLFGGQFQTIWQQAQKLEA